MATMRTTGHFLLRLVTLLAASGGFTGWVVAAAPPEAEVQGLYEGTLQDATGESKLEVRVVAQGAGQYKVLVRHFRDADKVVRIELAGTTTDTAVSLAGQAGEVEWKGTYAAGAFQGECGPGSTFAIQRVERKSPTLGQQPPEGAVVLLNGKDFSELVRAHGADWYLGDMSQEGWIIWEAPLYTRAPQDPAEWPSPDKPFPKDWVLSKERRRADTVVGIGEDGSLRVPKGGMNSKRTFEGSFDLHVEFLNPLLPAAHGQGRGNSGVYLPCGEEIQVLDSFGETTYTGGGCGGLYAYQDPATMEVIDSLQDKPEHKFTLASLPPLSWQTYDIEYRVERQDGKYVGKPRVTVYHNGIKIHDQFPLRAGARQGGIHFQDHGNPVRYRNIWVRPVEQHGAQPQPAPAGERKP